MQKEIQLTDKTLLVVGLPSNFKYGEVIFDEFWYSTNNRKLSETGKVIELGSLGYEFLGIYPELTEEQLATIGLDLESFQSLMEREKCYTVNPYEKPMMEKYGWYSSNSQEEESGWMYEEGEDKYYEVLKEWQEAQQTTFDKYAILIKSK